MSEKESVGAKIHLKLPTLAGIILRQRHREECEDE